LTEGLSVAAAGVPEVTPYFEDSGLPMKLVFAEFNEVFFFRFPFSKVYFIAVWQPCLLIFKFREVRVAKLNSSSTYFIVVFFLRVEQFSFF